MAAVHLLVPLINTVEREEEVELDGEVEEPGLSSIRTSRSRVEKEEVGKEEKSVYFDSGEGTGSAEENDIENSKPLTHGVINHANGHEAENKLEFDNGVHAGEGHHAVTEIVNIETSVVNKELRLSSHQSEIKSDKPIGEGNELKEIVNIETSVVNKELRLSSHQSEIKSDEPIGEGNELKEIVNIETSVVNKELRLSSHQSEIKSDEPIGEGSELKEEVVEYDVEKVLEEQETHDLFCPKCQSCITKRVILRKRKRIGEPLRSESKRGKLPDEGIDVRDDLVDPSNPDLTQPGKVFRCLECLSIFFATASGLKIFRIFGKKEEVSSQQSSTQTPVQESNSIGSSSVIAQNLGESSGSRNEGDPKHKQIDQSVISVLPSPHLERDAGSGRKKESASQQSDLGSQRDDETCGKIETATKHHAAHGFEFLRFFRRKYDDQKPETHEQDTTTIPNIGGLMSHGLDSSQSSTVESEGIEQLDEGGHLLPESIQVTPLPAIPGTSTGEHLVDIGPIDEKPTYDVLKSVVYGGLVELITSLGVISSAAGSNSTTLNIVVLALANLVGGLTVLAHNLKELISGPKESDQTSRDEDRYFKTLGLRANYRLHVVVSIISYIIFGLLPPIIYGFSFRKSDEKNYKLIAVAGASLFCILLLAIGKAHVQQASHKPYIKTVIYYLATGLTSTGLSYAVGELLRRALEETGLFDSTAGGSTSSSTSMLGTWSPKSGWEAY